VSLVCVYVCVCICVCTCACVQEDELRGVELSVGAMKEDQEGLTGRLVDAEAMVRDFTGHLY